MSAADAFERYYAEKLWSWIPEIHRAEDTLAQAPGVLRAWVELVARQIAVARRSIDRLWEDQSIEVCDDWAIPYIGALVGTRLVHELNRRARRVDVARTIFYRRRKGTPRVLEQLVDDITGWDGALVEAFRRLQRTFHKLDPLPAGRGGRVTGSLPGGWPELRSPRIPELFDGPFDELARTPDVRQLRGRLGRYNIPKLNYHLYRLEAFPVLDGTPTDLGSGRFTFDPSGRDVPLFCPSRRSLADCRPALEHEIAAPIRCHFLGEAFFEITSDVVDALALPAPAADELRLQVGLRFPTEARLRETLAALQQAATVAPRLDDLLRLAMTADCGKRLLFGTDQAVAVAIGAGPADVVPVQQVSSANLSLWGSALSLPSGRVLAVDPERGRFFPLLVPPGESVFAPLYHYGFPGDVGAGTYERRSFLVEGASPLTPPPGPVVIPNDGAWQADDNATRTIAADVLDVDQLVVQGENQRRPYLVRSATPPAWTLTALAKPVLPPGTEEPPADQRLLTFEGLWIGAVDPAAGPVPPPLTPSEALLVLDGVYDRVVIRHSTLDPGGERAALEDGTRAVIPYLKILVRGSVEELIIDSSIVGPIGEDIADPVRRKIGKLTVRDSIVQAPPGVPAIATALGELVLERVTVFGDVTADRLSATEALVQGVMQIVDNQHGCFRFSATQAEGAELPPQYESHLFVGGIPDHFFVSRRFGDPGYAQLSETAPPEIATGAENRSEIGVWNQLLDPIKVADLSAKVDEFAPLGLINQFVFET